jgi:hypothetical protein
MTQPAQSEFERERHPSPDHDQRTQNNQQQEHKAVASALLFVLMLKIEKPQAKAWLLPDFAAKIEGWGVTYSATTDRRDDRNLRSSGDGSRKSSRESKILVTDENIYMFPNRALLRGNAISKARVEYPQR